MTLAERMLAEASAWIGTPYRHQGRRKGLGCDCVGLIAGVWREVTGRALALPHAYSPDWAEAGGGEPLLDGARAIATEKPDGAIAPGDLVLFRWRPGLPVKHAGIACDGDHFIHAYEGCAVMRSALVPQWRRRIAAVLAFDSDKEKS